MALRQNSADLQLAVIAVVSLLSMPAIAGDEDESSPYLIYIDPETGRYTTTDPESATVTAQNVEENAPVGSDEVQRDIPLLSVGVVIACALLLAGVLVIRRRA